MNTKSNVVKADIRIGDGVISIRRKGVSEITTARVLGYELYEDGRTACLYLDRLLHGLNESELGADEGPWQLGGAFTSTMTKALSLTELMALRREGTNAVTATALKELAHGIERP